MTYNVRARSIVIACLLMAGGCSKPAATTDATTPSVTAPAATSNSALPSSQPGSSVAEAPPAATAPPVKVVRAGKTIVVTADEEISSETSNPGEHFAASLATPVVVDGVEVIPSGARATGTVTEAKSAGKFKGNAEIGVTLNSITVHGQKYFVQTTSISEAGKGRGKRTAIGAGGGAAIGGIIGALAGHGKGAAIGAVAGAGAGTAGAAYTGDKDITIRAETKLEFKLEKPLEIGGN